MLTHLVYIVLDRLATVGASKLPYQHFVGSVGDIFHPEHSADVDADGVPIETWPVRESV